MSINMKGSTQQNGKSKQAKSHDISKANRFVMSESGEGEFCQTKDIGLIKTNDFCAKKNRFHTFSVANHYFSHSLSLSVYFELIEAPSKRIRNF